MINELILSVAIPLGWLAIGYFLGNLNGKKKDIREFVDETGQKIQIEVSKLRPEKTTPTGRIKPITPEEAYKRNLNPQRKEALGEVKNTLDNIPELVKAKELAEQMRRERDDNYGNYGR